MSEYSNEISEVQVSDHALVRWLERVGGIDMDFFRREIAERCGDIAMSGASGAWIDEHWAVFDHGKVVTFLPDKPKTQMRHRQYAKKMSDLD